MENWKAVVGFENIYEVSDLGNVRRIAPWSDGRKTRPKERFNLRTKHRYASVVLHDKKTERKKEVRVHRLVMASFVGPLPYDHEVNHKNGDKKDNRLENLEYVTHSENQIHSYRVLKSHHFKGSSSGTAKVTEGDVFAIRALRKRGWQLKKLSKQFGLSPSTICWICKNKAWRHI